MRFKRQLGCPQVVKLIDELEQMRAGAKRDMEAMSNELDRKSDELDKKRRKCCSFQCAFNVALHAKHFC